MTRHRNPRRKVPKRTAPDNFTLGLQIRRIYDALVELEALAITADEAASMLPPGPLGRHKRTLTRLYTLVGKTAGQATTALEFGEELVALSPCTRPRSVERSREPASVCTRRVPPRPARRPLPGRALGQR